MIPLRFRFSMGWMLVAAFLFGLANPVESVRAETRQSHSKPDRVLSAVLLHRQHAARLPGSAELQSGLGRVEGVLPDAGNVAVLDDSDGVLLQPNLFDLDQMTLRFTPLNGSADQYTFSVEDSVFDEDALSSGDDLALGDDDARRVTIPFPFPFFGQTYDSVFVNSDGNLTFGVPDIEIAQRDLARAVGGPPRIAPLFNDLDPTQPNAPVVLASSPDHVVVTWDDVPEFDFAGSGLRQTFQVTLHPDGQIDFSYRGITASDAIVGIAPGNMPEETSMVDFSGDPGDPSSNAIMEAFSSLQALDVLALSQKFYRNHGDAYDFLVVFQNFDAGLDLPFFAVHLPIRNFVRGIGLFLGGFEEFDFGDSFGSPKRLQCLVYMGRLDRYPEDPNSTLSLQLGVGLNSTLSILGQELGHRFLAFPFFIDPDTGSFSTELLGRDFAHWSFYLDSDASVMEGNDIEDKGEGVSPRFETVEIVKRYSMLDRYLMGLIPAGDVPPTFLVTNPSIDFPSGHQPQPGVLFDGERKDIEIQAIIDAEGRRAPDHTVSQKNFRSAFVLLTRTGEMASVAEIDKMDRIRTEWGDYFEGAVDSLGQNETALVRQLDLSTWPASGVVQGRTVTANVSLGEDATSPLTVNLSSDNGNVSVPSSVMIPVGARSAEFTLTGMQDGVSTLTAQVDDPTYEVSESRIQVRAGGSEIEMERLFQDVIELFGTWRPGSLLPYNLRFRLRDENFVPYPELPIKITVTGDGSAIPAQPVTDVDGSITVDWKLDSKPGENLMTLEVQGLPGPVAEVRAVGARQPPRRRDPRVVLLPP